MSDTREVLARTWLATGALVHGLQTSFFDDFVESGIHDVVAGVPPLVVTMDACALTVKPIRVAVWRHPQITEEDKPRALFPHLARGVKTLCYDVPMFVTFDVQMHEYQEVTARRELTLKVADVPVMVRSRACSLVSRASVAPPDPTPGGHFIVRGAPRVMLPQEQLACNLLMRTQTRAGWTVRIKSRGSNRVISDLAMDFRTLKDGRIVARHARLAKNVSALLVLRAAGAALPDHECVRDLARLEKLPETTNEAVEVLSASVQLCDGLSREERVARTRDVVRDLLVPHASNAAAFLTFMVEELMQCAAGKRETDDPDHARCKRFETCDVMMAELLAVAMRTFMNRCAKKMRAVVQSRAREGADAARVVRSLFESTEKWLRNRCVTAKLQGSIATGVWPRLGSGRRARRKVDITEALGEKNAIDTIEHLRKTTGPGSGKRLESRSFHPTHVGNFCPFETPDGDKTGLVKYFSTFASVSRSFDLRVEWSTLPRGSSTLLVNGDLVSTNVDGLEVARWVRSMRRRRLVAHDVGVSFDCARNVVDVRTDAGRVLQTLIRVRSSYADVVRSVPETLRALWSRRAPEASSTWREPHADAVALWELARSRGWIETLDAAEMAAVERPNTSLVVVAESAALATPRTTHLQLMGGSFASVVANTAVFAGNNQVTRTAFYVSMAKQTVSSPVETYRGINSSTLDCPQRLLVTTQLSRWLRLNEESPTGVNAVLAILTDRDNYEDSLVVKRSFVQRGGFRMTSRHSYTVTVDDDEEIMGDVVEVGAFVRGNDVLVSKRRRVDGRDTSVAVRALDYGFVESVSASTLARGREPTSKLREVVVTLRVSREVVEGDKLCMAHGQKGTVGRVVSDEDMPYSAQTGMSPDVLFNPHALPSRGTFGPLMEVVAGKAAAALARDVDATAWELGSGSDVWRDVLRQLHDRGFASDGVEAFVNGQTGTMMQARVSVGIVGMRRLKQLADEKQRAVARGAVDAVTRQPVRGRANQGALRFGGMEADAVLAHGASAVLRDRLTSQCDEVTTRVCSCGAVVNTPTCAVCGERGEDFTTKYAFLLALQEMRAIGIEARMRGGGSPPPKRAQTSL